MKKALKIGWIGWIALHLCVFGCAAYHPHPISPSQTLRDFESRRLNDLGLKEFLEVNLQHTVSAWPLTSWNLDELTLAAFYFHPDLDVARAKWGVAKAGIKTAGEHPNPTLGILPQYVSNADNGNVPWILPFALDIPIETAGKRGDRVAQTKHLSEAARLNIATVVWQVRSRLRAALLDFCAAKKNVEILGHQLRLQEENFKSLNAQSSEKLVSPFVLNDKKLQVDQTLLSMREAEEQLVESLVRVASAIGVPIAALEGINLELRSFDHPPERLPSDEIRRQALLSRPDILAALAQYAAAESALQLEIVKQYPDINLGSGYEFDQSKNKWSLGLSITLPIFNQNKGAIANAEAHRTEAEANFNALQAQAIGEIDQARAGYEATLKEFKAARHLLVTQRNQQQLLQATAGQGEMRRVALLKLQVESAAATLSYFKTLVDVERSLGSLEDAMQRPFDNQALSGNTELNPREDQKTKEE